MKKGSVKIDASVRTTQIQTNRGNAVASEHLQVEIMSISVCVHFHLCMSE